LINASAVGSAARAAQARAENKIIAARNFRDDSIQLTFIRRNVTQRKTALNTETCCSYQQNKLLIVPELVISNPIFCLFE
jgi:hypothetical protein